MIMFINCNDDKKRLIRVDTITRVVRLRDYILEVEFVTGATTLLFYDTLSDAMTDYERINIFAIKRRCAEGVE